MKRKSVIEKAGGWWHRLNGRDIRCQLSDVRYQLIKNLEEFIITKLDAA